MNDLSIKRMLQTYIPKVLENDVYFRSYCKYLFDQYDFKADREHLRKKLNSYLRASQRDDNVALAQRLIRGENKTLDTDKENWIWLSSKDVGVIAQKTIEANTLDK